MKDIIHLQTPQKDRKTKSLNEQSKKPQKITKKCLNSAFTSVSEDVMLESPKGSIDFSPISEVSDNNHLVESTEILAVSSNSDVSPSCEILTPSDLSVLSSGDVSVNGYESAELNVCKISGVEVDMVVKHLKQARIELLNSVDIDVQFKKVLDALINVVIEEFYGLPEERDWFTETVSRKTRVVFVSLALWILAVAATCFFTSGDGISFNQLPPT